MAKRKEFNSWDVNTVYGPAANLSVMFDEKGVFEGIGMDAVMFQSSMPALTEHDGDRRVNPEGVEVMKGKAQEYEKRIDDYMAQNPDRLKDTPRARAYQDELLRAYKQDFRNIQMGVSTRQEREFDGPGLFGPHNLAPNMKLDCFYPENLEKTEKALQQYPLDQFLKYSNDLQDAHMDYMMGREERSEERNAALREEMREKKEQLLSVAKELQEKSKDPTPETLNLFSDKTYLSGPTGFISHRGLDTVITDLEKDLSLSTTREMKGLEDSLTKFNTSRASIFKKESDEHRAMREAAEKVQENMRKLKDSKLSAEERNRLKRDTMDAIGKMEEMTDRYIEHASPNGKVPSTTAGKERLAGARELKEFATNMKERVAQDPDVKLMLQKEQEAKYREACKADDAKFRESLSGGAQRFYDSKMKSFQQFDGMSRNTFHDASPNARYFGVNNFELMAAEMIAMSVVKEGIKNGNIEADRIHIEHEKAVKSIMKDENFEKWRETFKDNVDAQRGIGPKPMDELRQDFVKSMSKELQASVAKEHEKAKEAEKSKSAEKTTAKTKSKTVNRTNDKKEIKPIEKGGMKL